jgi:nicotinate-nucleotide adenylyltransferase
MTPVKIGLLGGTFDPIHNGHLHIAQSALEHLALTAVHFIPCKQPVHKTLTHATTTQRAAMLASALTPPNFILDRRELERDSASYCVTTVQSFRDEYPRASLCLIMGSDNLNQFTTWHQWQRLLTLTHLVVYIRPGHPLAATLDPELSRRLTTHKNDLCTPAGTIYVLPEQANYSSSTKIREHLARGHLPDQELPGEVTKYIQQHRLYQ